MGQLDRGAEEGEKIVYQSGMFLSWGLKLSTLPYHHMKVEHAKYCPPL